MDQPHARFTPSWFRARLYKAYRELEHYAGVRLGWRDPLIPPLWLDSGGRPERFRATGEEFFKYFVELCNLKPHESVLEVGCGTGRMARPLTRFLSGGSYDGFDIVAPSIEWCKKAYHHPAFRFHHADLYNKEYNPRGKYQPSDYRFPFPDSSFDFVILTSVFTHMLRSDVEHYVREISRVLKVGGRCLITYFLVNTDSRKHIAEGSSRYDFRCELPGCFVQQFESPETVAAYEECTIRELYERSRLIIVEPIHYGAWCGRRGGLSTQDIVIGYKAS